MNTKNITKYMVTFVLGLILAGAISVIAISVPPAEPENEPGANATMYSLTAIYQKLTTGTTVLTAGDLTTEDDASTSHYTLADIFDALPIHRTLTNDSTILLEGYYEETDMITEEANLIPENIKEGVSIFGVAGTAVSVSDYYCGNPVNASCWSDDAPTNLSWSTEEIETGAQNDYDGEVNTATLVALAGSYPAAEYCYNLTEGGVPIGTWYLPAKNQLLAGWHGLSDTFASFYYWSSTEDPNTPENLAWYLNIDGWSMYTMNKVTARSVRCFR